MKEHPILFNEAMVRAILDGTKTQTRRVVKRPYVEGNWSIKPALNPRFNCHTHDWYLNDAPLPVSAIKCPYGQVGDRLWVRETFSTDCCGDGEYYYKASINDKSWYELNQDEIAEMRWTPSIHMPRKASRITLEINNVRVERLQDISEDDAKEEGVIPCEKGGIVRCHSWAFKELWESINGTESWNANPWVWVIEFKRVEVAA